MRWITKLKEIRKRRNNVYSTMTRSNIIDALKEYFEIYELVSREVYNTHGENAWFLFRTETLMCLLMMRVGIDKPFTINDWYWEGFYDERGYRENTSDIVKDKTDNNKLYLSGHVLGCAIDFTVKDMSADLVREWIEENQDMFPCKIRLEDKKDGEPITWVHFDTKHYEQNPKVYRFNV